VKTSVFNIVTETSDVHMLFSICTIYRNANCVNKARRAQM